MRTRISWKPVINSLDAASFRLRSFLPAKYLEQAGWPCEVFSAKNSHRYNLVIFQKAYSDDDLKLVKELKSRGVKTVFDLCDNHFYNPQNLPTLDERAIRLQRMIDLVDSVSVSTPELAKLIQGKQPTVIDDAVEMPEMNQLVNAIAGVRSGIRQYMGDALRLVWYGHAGLENPPFGIVDIPKILPSLEELHSELPISLTVISNSRDLYSKYINRVSFPVKYCAWKRSTFPYIFRQHDVCLVPVNVNPFTICKTNNRLALSLLLGVPVIADKIPGYEEFKSFVLFSDWKNSIQAYASDRELRRRHVLQGRQFIHSKYNKERVVHQWSSLFRTLLGETNG